MPRTRRVRAASAARDAAPGDANTGLPRHERVADRHVACELAGDVPAVVDGNAGFDVEVVAALACAAARRA